MVRFAIDNTSSIVNKPIGYQYIWKLFIGKRFNSNYPPGFEPKNTKRPDVEPVKIYSNSETQKSLILKDNKDKQGVYRWVNLVNGKTYVGSSVNIRNRMYKYFSVWYLTRFKRIPICSALHKYGYNNFRLEILEYCDKAETLNRENYFINLLKPEYNIMQHAIAPMTGRVHSAETLKLMSVARAGTGSKHPSFGKTLSDEVRKKISDSVKGDKHSNFGKITNMNVREKISKSKGTAVKVMDLQTNEAIVYASGNL